MFCPKCRSEFEAGYTRCAACDADLVESLPVDEEDYRDHMTIFASDSCLHNNPSAIKEYADLGIESFIFSGYPHLEEAYRFAELVFPLLPQRLRDAVAAPLAGGPRGEVVGNLYVPQASASFAKLGFFIAVWL